jgi:hypothetical protein
MYVQPDADYHEMVHACWEWMLNCYLDDNQIPPRYLTVEFHHDPERREWGAAFLEALDQIRDELKEHPVVDPEESGRQWIEEEFKEGKKRRRKSEMKRKGR